MKNIMSTISLSIILMAIGEAVAAYGILTIPDQLIIPYLGAVMILVGFAIFLLINTKYHILFFKKKEIEKEANNQEADKQ
jgi:hypothetical protein